MRRIALSISMALAVLANQGTSDLFLHDLVTVADAYYGLGVDNNYLDMKLMGVEKFTARAGANEMSLHYTKVSQLSAIIKECVFMNKGAYGDHLDPELQDRISYVFARTISTLATKSNTPTNVFSTTNPVVDMSTGIFNASCVFGIEHDGQVLLMQGAAMD